MPNLRFAAYYWGMKRSKTSQRKSQAEKPKTPAEKADRFKDRYVESDRNPATDTEGIVPNQERKTPKVLPGGAPPLEEQGIDNPHL